MRDDKRLLAAKKELYIELLRLEANEITDFEADMLYALAADPHIQQILTRRKSHE